MGITLPILRPSRTQVSRDASSSVSSFHVMMKPAGPACNLACDYCYYLHKEQLLDLPGLTSMRTVSDETLERFIKQHIESQRVPHIVFTWHGGEPTLLGLDFFHKVVELQHKHLPPGMKIRNELQTNGILLDEKWCQFLRENTFYVGLSIDGPRDIHDRMRPTAGGQRSFDRVYTTARRLQKHGVIFSTLTVISPANVHRALELYDFLTRDLGSHILQFLPSAERRDFKTVAPGFWDSDSMPFMGSPQAGPGHPDSVVTEWSIGAEDWGRFLSQIFDRWYASDTGKVHISWFHSWIGQWLGTPASMCLLAETCGTGLAVEMDGNVYSCDHYVYPEYRLGNISTVDFGDLARSEKQSQFGKDKRNKLPLYCHSCEYNFACHGECPRRRFLKTPDGESGLNYFCEGYKLFFKHAGERIKRLGQRRQQGEHV